MMTGYMLGNWIFGFLIFVVFWIGVGTLLVWLSKSNIREKNLLLTGLILALGALFFVSLVMFSFHMTGGLGCSSYDSFGPGFMMRGYLNR
jgi:hypothetical protein